MSDGKAHAFVRYVYKSDGRLRWNHDPACCWCGAAPHHVAQVGCKGPGSPHALFDQREWRKADREAGA